MLEEAALEAAGSMQQLVSPEWAGAPDAAESHSTAAMVGLAVETAHQLGQPPSKELVADLCEIIERQSKEIANLREGTNQKPIKGKAARLLKNDSANDNPESEDPVEYQEAREPGHDFDDGSETLSTEGENEDDEYRVDDESGGRKRQRARFTSGLEALSVAADDMSCGIRPHSIAKRRAKQRRDDGSAQPQCTACGTTQTPKWRCGMTLCNACGLRNAKRYTPRRASSSNSLVTNARKASTMKTAAAMQVNLRLAAAGQAYANANADADANANANANANSAAAPQQLPAGAPTLAGCQQNGLIHPSAQHFSFQPMEKMANTFQPAGGMQPLAGGMQAAGGGMQSAAGGMAVMMAPPALEGVNSMQPMATPTADQAVPSQRQMGDCSMPAMATMTAVAAHPVIQPVPAVPCVSNPMLLGPGSMQYVAQARPVQAARAVHERPPASAAPITATAVIAGPAHGLGSSMAMAPMHQPQHQPQMAMAYAPMESAPAIVAAAPVEAAPQFVTPLQLRPQGFTQAQTVVRAAAAPRNQRFATVTPYFQSRQQLYSVAQPVSHAVHMAVGRA